MIAGSDFGHPPTPNCTKLTVLSDARRDTRHKVHLSVRYSTAREFVREYAENLSKGGLFIRDAYSLEPLQQVTVRMELPGFHKYDILAEVVHLIRPDVAAQLNRAAGAGLAIVRAPSGFEEALERYLQRLGQRKDHQVLIADEPMGILLGSCGYRVSRAPLPSETQQKVAESARPVIGVIVPEALVADYRRALAKTDAHDVVHDLEGFANIDEILAQLDRHLMARLGVANGSPVE